MQRLKLTWNLMNHENISYLNAKEKMNEPKQNTKNIK